MKTHVTITLDPAVHSRAKQAARARRTTLSALIESFPRSPAAAPPTRAGGGSSLVDEMLGSAQLREVTPRTDVLFDSLRARYSAPDRPRNSGHRRQR
jgi:hypothetical protein